MDLQFYRLLSAVSTGAGNLNDCALSRKEGRGQRQAVFKTKGVFLISD